MANRKRSISSNGSDIHALHKELDEASCSICMDHPHNAVLLLCSSHEKGCRSYICDTSYRHSNCLDRYRKLAADNMKNPLLPNVLSTNEESSSITSDGNSDLRTFQPSDFAEAHENHNLDGNVNVSSLGVPDGQMENAIHHTNRHLELQEGILEVGNSESLWGREESEQNNVGSSSLARSGLKCPLCRGTVLGLKVVEEARKYLNMKPRSCSRESCSFLGNYRELRRHARRVHPTSRPADTDPSRLRAWRHLEHQREYGDIVSAIRSAIPGAVMLGDYVIENGDRVQNPGILLEDFVNGNGGDRVQNERDRESNRPWWTTFFLFQMIGAMDPVAEPRGGGSRSRVWRRHRRSTGGALSGRRYLWGENLLGLQDNDDEDGNNNIDLNTLGDDDDDDDSPIPRRRRRLTRTRSDEDQS